MILAELTKGTTPTDDTTPSPRSREELNAAYRGWEARREAVNEVLAALGCGPTSLAYRSLPTDLPHVSVPLETFEALVAALSTGA